MDISGLGLTHEAIRDAVAAGLVTDRSESGLSILNYTPRAQYSGAWNTVTRQCRGLILDGSRVVARGLPKFFNHGQPEADRIELCERVVVMDKVDGSLGVIYPVDGGWRVATRGSFTSPQAVEGTKMLDALGYAPPAGLTVLVEIVYPENRIVLDYGQRRALVLLGAVEIATGASVFPDDPRLDAWPGERVEVLPWVTLLAALEAPPRTNAEGLVVMSRDGMRRLKIKQEDYVRLHKVLCGLSNASIWEALRAGDVGRLFEVAPDELHPWMRSMVAALTAEHDAMLASWVAAFNAIPAGLSRKDFAAHAKSTPNPGAVFAILDGRADVSDLAWKAVKPTERATPTNAEEAA